MRKAKPHLFVIRCRNLTERRLLQDDIPGTQHIIQAVNQVARGTHLQFFGGAQFGAGAFDVEHDATFAGRAGEQRLDHTDGAVAGKTQV